MIKYKSLMPEISIKYKSGDLKKHKITNVQDAYTMFKQMYDKDTLEYIESFIVIYLNRANNTIGWHKVSVGGTTGCLVDVKVIMATALKCNAHGLILSHNHPSGNLKPSNEDIKITKKLQQASSYFDIAILDHLIITSEGYYSFQEDDKL
jgi:DNA repair protein RadC